MNKAIRSQFKSLLDDEHAVRAWWKGVDEKKRDSKTPNRKMPAEPVVEDWVPRAGPSAEATEARQAAEAEAEAERLEAEEGFAPGARVPTPPCRRNSPRPATASRA